MIDQKDVQALRHARTEMSKRGIDVSRADIRVNHGICYVRGAVSAMPGANSTNMEEELHHAVRAIRQQPEIREVILEVDLPNTRKLFS